MHLPASDTTRPRWIAGALAAGVLVAALATPAGAQSVSVTLNGSPITLSPSPVTRDGRVFVPLRGVFEQLGASVVYAGGTINAQGNGHAVQLQIGSNRAIVDGNQQAIDVAPFILGASTFVPLRFVSQALGAQVSYDAGSKLVALSSGGTPAQEITPVPQRPPAPPPVSALVLRSVQPERDATLVSRRPTIEARFGNAQVDPNSVRVTFDGLDISGNASRSPDGIVFSPPSDLEFGQHTVRITGRDGSQRPFDVGWKFVTAPQPVPSVIVLRAVQPPANAAVESRRPTIEAQFGAAQADPNTVRVIVDGLDVSGNSSRSTGGVVFSPPSDLQFGPHTVHITGRDSAERAFDLAWQFTTTPDRQAAPPSVLGLRAVTPQANVQVATRRPTIEAQFGGAPANPSSVRVAVDGRDVTNESSVSPNGIVFSPVSDLQSGPHTVRITGRDMSERPFDRAWQFTTGSVAAANFIDELQPADNADIASSFVVTGRTQPYAHVIVQVGTTGDRRISVNEAIVAILGVGPHSQSVRAETDADAHGAFAVPVSIGADSGQTLGLVVDSTEPRTHAAARARRALVVR